VVARLRRLLVDPLPELAQSLNVELMTGQGGRIELGTEGVIGAAESDGEVATVREFDDQVGIDSAPDGDNLHPLPREGMMGMDDRDEL
jgi:hypothetical protein